MDDRFASIKNRLAMIEKLKDAQKYGLDTIKDSTGELGDDSILHPALKNLGKGIERNEDAEARQQALLESDPNKAEYDKLSKTRDSLLDSANFARKTVREEDPSNVLSGLGDELSVDPDTRDIRDRAGYVALKLANKNIDKAKMTNILQDVGDLLMI